MKNQEPKIVYNRRQVLMEQTTLNIAVKRLNNAKDDETDFNLFIKKEIDKNYLDFLSEMVIKERIHETPRINNLARSLKDLFHINYPISRQVVIEEILKVILEKTLQVEVEKVEEKLSSSQTFFY